MTRSSNERTSTMIFWVVIAAVIALMGPAALIENLHRTSRRLRDRLITRRSRHVSQHDPDLRSSAIAVVQIPDNSEPAVPVLRRLNRRQQLALQRVRVRRRFR